MAWLGNLCLREVFLAPLCEQFENIIMPNCWIISTKFRKNWAKECLSIAQMMLRLGGFRKDSYQQSKIVLLASCGSPRAFAPPSSHRLKRLEPLVRMAATSSPVRNKAMRVSRVWISRDCNECSLLCSSKKKPPPSQRGVMSQAQLISIPVPLPGISGIPGS